MSVLGLVVIDASAVVAALGPSQIGGRWATITLSAHRLVAPRLLPFEAGAAFRRMQLSGRADTRATTLAHDDLLALQIGLWPHRQLARRAWELRHSVTYTDACYVALAEILDAPLVTLDRRLAQAHGPRCTFLTPPE